MPYIQLDGQLIPLVAGDNGVGAPPGARVPLPDAGRAEVAVLAVAPDGSTVLRRSGEGMIVVNGVALGAEPIPLIHGDKIEIGARELFFGDDRKAGNTQLVPSVRIPAGAPAPAAAAPGAATGGRLVSLVDGREYMVPEHGLVIGRDPTCDVVVPSSEVSRKHAVIAPGKGGYVLTDTSTNGVLVNGAPVDAPTVLGRGMVVTVGGEEFRFHADAPAARGGGVASAEDAAPALPVLATLEVTGTGVLRGKRFELRLPLAHVGRGAHNDVVVADESVSDTHAKIQRREDGWYVVDMGSTNGTYVGGRRIAGESRMVGAPDLRFGGVKLVFRAVEGAGDGQAVAAPAAEVEVQAGGGRTRAIAALTPELRAHLAAQATAGARPQAPEGARQPGAPAQRAAHTSPDAGRSGGGRIVIWTLLLAAAAAGAFLLLASR